MSRSPLRVALVGLGHIGRVHAEAVRRTPRLTLVGGHDLNVRLAGVLPDGVPFDRTLTAALARDPDVVVVATPNITHAEVARQVLVHGSMVLLEKPAAVTREELASLYWAPCAAERLRFALHARYGREVIAALEFVDERGLGTSSRFVSYFEDPYLLADGSVRPEHAGLGDAWIDSGVNALSVLSRFIPLDRLEVADASAGGFSGDGRTVTATARFNSSAVSQELEPISGSITSRWSDQARKWTRLEWSNGTTMLLDHQREQLRVATPDGKRVLRNLATSDSRLINHYIGLFGELAVDSGGALTGKELGIFEIHRLFFDVADAVSAAVHPDPDG